MPVVIRIPSVSIEKIPNGKRIATTSLRTGRGNNVKT